MTARLKSLALPGALKCRLTDAAPADQPAMPM
eukprot:CAMPEP_0179137274 /NCGR_PEP_ID=MMETSP0796-20121207/65477_1 /TAXON_ID=73915 /ORGANISM="Pyrodinium bahamense, Strain pbaha01" /LENGTH=31 /DNA_ID= /DNA_START= /DNA_END= /DNA_ORIENTATION=